MLFNVGHHPHPDQIFEVIDLSQTAVKDPVLSRGVKWVKPGCYTVSMTEGMALLKALSNEKDVPPVQPAPVTAWIDRSVSIYMSALGSGVMPCLKLLAKVLACLRIPHEACKTRDANKTELKSFDPYADIDAYHDHTSPSIRKSPVETCFDKRAIQVPWFSLFHLMSAHGCLM